MLTRRRLDWSRFLTLFALLGLGVAAMDAQLAVTTATLSGTVTDPSGAIIPQATVKMSSVEEGIARKLTTDAGGHYSFTQLPPATYALEVQAQGFKVYKQPGIVLDAAQSASQNVALTIGSVSEEIVVSEQASLLNTQNANLSADIPGKEVVELPLNLRNVYGLATLNSSVNNTSESQMLLGGGGPSTGDADQDISFLNFAGGFFGTSAYLLDGAWDTDPEWGAVDYVPSVDSVQEFKVQNNSFTAQYGWSTGNVVNVVTKSGTNAFHGDVYGFYRNSTLDANLWFNNHNHLARSDFNRNQLGFSAGGPLYIPKLYKQREKTFIFGLYEHLSLSTPANSTFTVPNANFLAGHFAELLGPQQGVDALGRPIYFGQIYDPRSTRAITAGQVDPKTGLIATRSGYIRDPIQNNDITTLGPMDPTGVKLASYYPKATGPGITNNLVATGTNPAHSNEYTIRLDHNINDASRLYFRYSYKEEFKTGTPNYWGSSNPAGPGNARPNNRYNLAAGYSQIFSPTFTMNLMSGVEVWHETSTNQSRGFKPSSLGLPTYLDQNSPEFPIVTIGGQSPLGPLTNETVTNHGPIGSVALDFIKTHRRHTLNFGFMFVEQEDDQANYFQSNLASNGRFTTGPDPNAATGFTTGNGLAQLLLGVVDGGATGTTYNPAVAIHYFGGYLQDDWNPIPKLTLNLGLRYEIQTAPTYRHNVASVFNPNVPNPIGTALGKTLPGALQFLSDKQRASYDTNFNNWAPRVGFTYQAAPNVVVRGGYGIFYPASISCCFDASASGFASQTNVPFTLNAISPNPAVTLTNPWPNGFIPITGNALGEMQQVGYGVGSNFRQRAASYVQQYLVGLQWSITPSDMLDINYIGNKGTHMLTANINRSQLNPSYLSMGQAALNTLVPNPFYGAIAPGNSSCALDQPKVVQSQLLQPYPQFCGVTENGANIGFSNYNALQINFNHRFSKGLTGLVSYTYSKFLDNVEGNNAWSYSGNSGPANNYNLAAEKSVDGSDIPHNLVASYVYELPIGRGKAFGGGMSRLADAVVGGWEISQIATFKQGIPISVSGSDIASYGGSPRPDVIGNVHVAHQSIHEWFNTGAFAYAPYGTFGTAPRFFSYLRGPGYQNWDTAILKNWRFRESMRLQFRAELFNTFNHPQFYAPQFGGETYTGCDPNSGTPGCASSLGQITNAFPARTVQFAGKFYW
ncbi:TonB-dependent receptor domain-containing protein [Edaphobacter bradus]|uniref:TonB-dependent receptor domain-containing protein n=1 Tax=Edaphobacter bradus TaxID=2259016 RepID=UPI0021E00976|nr:TonB-dependent receptor [Edaphobacter bradus]